jgi:2-iminobutanoate/2-iminopropanoate deaminase
MIERLRLDGKLPEPISHYTDAVRAHDTLWISGLLPVDANGILVGGDDAEAQADQVLANLALVLGAAKASFSDVVKVGVYVRRMRDREAIDQARQRRFGDARPASTLVEVSALSHPDALVEIDAVAHLPSST